MLKFLLFQRAEAALKDLAKLKQHQSAAKHIKDSDSQLTVTEVKYDL